MTTPFPYERYTEAGYDSAELIAAALRVDGWEVTAQKTIRAGGTWVPVQLQLWELVAAILVHKDALDKSKEEK